jgi:RimJ/RimL family protein N-acetyltransferase
MTGSKSSVSPVIETARLILRPPLASDFEGWAAYMADEESARYIGRVQQKPVAWRGMATMAGSWALHGFGMFSVVEKATGQWVGRVGPWRPHGWPGDEVGWGVIRSVWGKGYAREAAVASMDFAVDVLGWTDIIHCIDPANVNSQNLARRLGSSNRGAGRMPAPFDADPIDIWGQTAAEWKKNRIAAGGS